MVLIAVVAQASLGRDKSGCTPKLLPYIIAAETLRLHGHHYVHYLGERTVSLALMSCRLVAFRTHDMPPWLSATNGFSGFWGRALGCKGWVAVAASLNIVWKSLRVVTRTEHYS